MKARIKRDVILALIVIAIALVASVFCKAQTADELARIEEIRKKAILYNDDEIILGMHIEKAMPFLKSKEKGVKYSKNYDGVEMLSWNFMGPFLSNQSTDKLFYFKKDYCDSIVFKLIKGVDIPKLLMQRNFEQIKYDSIPPNKNYPYIKIYRYYKSGLANLTYLVVKEDRRFDYRSDHHLIFTKP